ncbi:MAG TPA: hypothetical protein VHY84_22105 [Bryobacteraceae bacterium]|jgi:hypothetical protein|nr:hypothetical protein [Bryobacteraceae bacterium]
MSRPFLITFGVAVVVIGALIWFGFAKTAGNHLAPTGSIGKVRTIKAADDVTFMVIDFKVKNDSDRDMVVRSVESQVDTADGGTIMGNGVAATDIRSAFRSYPLLGEQYNPILKERDTIPAHQEVDRMVGLRFDAPAEKVESRKRVVLRLEDVTGPVVELTK